jgi:hypothetical protein
VGEKKIKIKIILNDRDFYFLSTAIVILIFFQLVTKVVSFQFNCKQSKNTLQYAFPQCLDGDYINMNVFE